MVVLPDGEKKFEHMYNRLDTTPACDRQTDRQTDILPRHSPRYAYGSRGNDGIRQSYMYNGGPMESRIYGVSNGATFNDLEQPLTPFSSSRYNLTLNMS